MPAREKNKEPAKKSSLDTASMEKVLRSVINSSPAVVFLWKDEPGWPVEFVSENISQFGYNVDDFISGNIDYIDIMHPEDREKVIREFNEHLLNNETNFTHRYRIVTGYGDIRWVDERTVIHYDDNGKILFIEGIVVDNTDIRRGDIALLDGALKMKKALQTVIDSSPVVVFLWRAEDDWPVEFVSDNISMFGYSVEDFTSGKLVYGDIVHPDDIGRVRAGVAKSTKDGYSDFFQEYRILTSSGEVRWVDERTKIQHNGKGHVTYLQGIIIDITGRKKIENVLHHEEMRMEAMLNLYQISDAPLDDITSFAIQEAVRFTGSQFGYIMFMTGENNMVGVDSWSGSDDVDFDKYPPITLFSLDDAGIWAEVFNKGAPTIVNDVLEKDPLVPIGGSERMIQRSMSVPIFDGDDLIGAVGLANKSDGYNLSDVRHMTLLMQSLWNILRHKMADEELRQYAAELNRSYEIQKILGEVIKNSPAVVFLWRAEDVWPVEFVSDNVSQFGYSVDDFLSGDLVFADIVHPYDLKRVQKELAKRIDAGYTDFNQEYRIMTKHGDVRWVDERTFIKHDENGEVTYLQGIIVDVTDRKHGNEFLHMQFDVDSVLSNASNLQEAFERLLDFCITIKPVDSGRVYLVDELTGDLILKAHRGLSQRFIDDTSHFPTKSVQKRMILNGQPVYTHHSELNALNAGKDLQYEGLNGTAIIPVKIQSDVIGALSLSSHNEYEIPDDSRSVLETIASQMGVVISRMQSSSENKQLVKDFQLLFDHLDDMIFVLDLNGYILYANNSAAVSLGYSKRALLNMSYIELHSETEWDMVDSSFSKVGPDDKLKIKTIFSDMEEKKFKVNTEFISTRWNSRPALIALSRRADE